MIWREIAVTMTGSAFTPRHDQMIWREIAVTMTRSKDSALLAYTNITKFLLVSGKRLVSYC